MRHTNNLAIWFVASAAFLAAQPDPPSRVGRLNYTSGAISFQPAGEPDWVDAAINRPLIPGDSLWTPAGTRAELHIGSTAIRLAPNTAFQLINLDDQTVQIRLTEGTLSVHIRDLQPREVFEVNTPNIAFTAEAEGEYRIDADPDTQTTTISVRDGNGDVTGGGQSFPLTTRQRAVIVGDQQITWRLTSVPITDAWDQWSSGRDRREDQSQSARYVSRDVAGYEDLDQYGRWSNQSGYGDVWMPSSVDAGWAPYRNGQWSWIAPWGWTWVDDAPWGFAPYHYGRWAMFGSRWGWVPGPRGVRPVYAPALVAWIGGAGFSASIGWFALGPREPYFPSYNVTQGYFRRVNSTNTVINTTTINNYYLHSRNANNPVPNNIRYANRNVSNGVTVLPHDDFASGRRVGPAGRAMTPAQLGQSQVYGSPRIAPQRESVLGTRRDSANRVTQPPARAFSRPVVARTPPPPPPVPFNRQREALAKEPGRPLSPAAAQQVRQAEPPVQSPVRVVEQRKSDRQQPSRAPSAEAPAREQRQPEQPRRAAERAPRPAAPQPATEAARPPAQPSSPQAAQPQPASREQRQPEQPRREADRAPRPPAQQPATEAARPQAQPAPPQAAQPQPASREQRQPEQPRREADRAPRPRAQQPPPEATRPQAPPASPQTAQPQAVPRQERQPPQSRREADRAPRPAQQPPPEAARPQAQPAPPQAAQPQAVPRQERQPQQSRREADRAPRPAQQPPPEAARPQAQPAQPQAETPPRQQRQEKGRPPKAEKP